MTSIYIFFIILGLFGPYVLGEENKKSQRSDVTLTVPVNSKENPCENGTRGTNMHIENCGDNRNKPCFKQIEIQEFGDADKNVSFQQDGFGKHNEILWENEKNNEDRKKDPSKQDRRDKYKETSKKSMKNHEAKKKYRFKRDGPGSISCERVSCKLWWRVRGKEDCCKSFRKG